METCHLCGQPLPHHEDQCRTHQDLALFVRVYHRLRAEDRNPALRDKLARHLVRHGRMDGDCAA